MHRCLLVHSAGQLHRTVDLYRCRVTVFLTSAKASYNETYTCSYLSNIMYRLQSLLL